MTTLVIVLVMSLVGAFATLGIINILNCKATQCNKVTLHNKHDGYFVNFDGSK